MWGSRRYWGSACSREVFSTTLPLVTASLSLGLLSLLEDVTSSVGGENFCGGQGTWAAPVAPIRARLPLDPEELRRRPPENLDPVLVAEPGNRNDVVDWGGVPRERVIGPKDHAIDPHLGDQVPHALARKHDRIEIQLSASEIFGRLLL